MVEGKRPAGKRVLVYDCDGYYMGSALAEKLAREGHTVTLVTPLYQVAPFTEYTLELPRIKRTLFSLNVNVVTEHTLDHMSLGVAKGTHIYDPRKSAVWEIDSVVLVTSRYSDKSLFRELEADPGALKREGIQGLYRIGDCVSAADRRCGSRRSPPRAGNQLG